MSLTVKQLTEIPFLRTRFLAGETGSMRIVEWAHTCELPEPWNWLGNGELLLSDGYNFPAEPDSQVKFLRNLFEANISGIALAEGMHAPSLTPEAAKAADEMGFPVLETSYNVPFVTVSRTVADSNNERASASLTRVVRVYDVLRRLGQQRSSRGELLRQLGEEAGARLSVLSVRSLQPVLSAETDVPESSLSGLRKWLLRTKLPLPAYSRIDTGEGSFSLAMPLGEGNKAVLLAAAKDGDSQLDLVVLQHVAVIVNLEVERQSANLLRRRERGGELVRQLIEGRADLEAAAAFLDTVGLNRKPWRVLSFSLSEGIEPDDIQIALLNLRITHLVALLHSEFVVLLPEHAADLDPVAITNDSDVHAGLSQPLHSLGRMADAVRESRWAAEAARSAGLPVSAYGENAIRFFPRTVAEGEAVVDQILGPIINYDDSNNTQLLHTLQVYFDANCSWQEGADRLGIHKQTLVYRIQKIEKLTSRKLRTIEDQTILYLAVRTHRYLSGL